MRILENSKLMWSLRSFPSRPREPRGFSLISPTTLAGSSARAFSCINTYLGSTLDTREALMLIRDCRPFTRMAHLRGFQTAIRGNLLAQKIVSQSIALGIGDNASFYAPEQCTHSTQNFESFRVLPCSRGFRQRYPISYQF